MSSSFGSLQRGPGTWKTWLYVGALVCALASVRAAAVASETFEIVSGAPNLVRFVSKAPLETFDGTTDHIAGHVTLNPKALGEWIDVYLEVDLATFDTGIGLRNRHMRENHLETDKYPMATLRGGRVHEVSATQLEPKRPVTLEIEGILELHGVQKALRVTVELTYSLEDGIPQLSVFSRFEVKLSDFDIPRPKFLFMQLNEVQRIEVELIAKSGHVKPARSSP